MRDERAIEDVLPKVTKGDHYTLHLASVLDDGEVPWMKVLTAHRGGEHEPCGC